MTNNPGTFGRFLLSAGVDDPETLGRLAREVEMTTIDVLLRLARGARILNDPRKLGRLAFRAGKTSIGDLLAIARGAGILYDPRKLGGLALGAGKTSIDELLAIAGGAGILHDPKKLGKFSIKARLEKARLEETKLEEEARALNQRKAMIKTAEYEYALYSQHKFNLGKFLVIGGLLTPQDLVDVGSKLIDYNRFNLKDLAELSIGVICHLKREIDPGTFTGVFAAAMIHEGTWGAGAAGSFAGEVERQGEVKMSTNSAGFIAVFVKEVKKELRSEISISKLVIEFINASWGSKYGLPKLNIEDYEEVGRLAAAAGITTVNGLTTIIMAFCYNDLCIYDRYAAEFIGGFVNGGGNIGPQNLAKFARILLKAMPTIFGRFMGVFTEIARISDIGYLEVFLLEIRITNPESLRIFAEAYAKERGLNQSSLRKLIAALTLFYFTGVSPCALARNYGNYWRPDKDRVPSPIAEGVA
jgi:hypothetical protein